jgi:hypothetical protein
VVNAPTPLRAILVTWFGVHAERVNADRLTHLVASMSPRVQAFWSALALWRAKDRRFARMAKCYAGPRIDLLDEGTAFHVRRHGEDKRFAQSALRVPGNVLRDRPGDVATPTQLAKSHRAYRMRVIIGPSYRADMWAALDAEPRLSAAQLARKAYGSFATAWHTRKDWTLVRRGQVARKP